MSRASPVRRIDPATFDPPASVRAILAAPQKPQAQATVADCGLQWHPAFIAPLAHAAERAEEFIARLGFESWWPRAVIVQKRPRRSNALMPTVRGASRYVKKVVTRPLLPRYVLVRLPVIDAPFGRLSDDRARQHGLFGIVANGAGPAVISDAVVEDLRQREAAGEFDATQRRRGKVVEKLPDWAVVGGQVEVADGPFASFNATIEAIIGERAKAAVAIFGRTTLIDVEIDQLRAGR